MLFPFVRLTLLYKGTACVPFHPYKQEDRQKSYHVIARRAKPDVTIRILSGAKYLPSPWGTEGKRIATACGLAMTCLFWPVPLFWHGSRGNRTGDS